jgi:hypothetical protein
MTSCQPCSKKTLEHVAISITFRWMINCWPLGSLKQMFSLNLCPYSYKRIAGIQHLLLHGGVIVNKDLLHLSNNTSWWIDLFENWPKGQDGMFNICKKSNV